MTYENIFQQNLIALFSILFLSKDQFTNTKSRKMEKNRRQLAKSSIDKYI